MYNRRQKNHMAFIFLLFLFVLQLIFSLFICFTALEHLHAMLLFWLGLKKPWQLYSIVGFE